MKKIAKISLIIATFIMMFYTFSNNFVYADDGVPSWEVSEQFDPGSWDPRYKERTKPRRRKTPRNW